MMIPLLTYGQAFRICHPLLLLLTCLAEEQKGDCLECSVQVTGHGICGM